VIVYFGWLKSAGVSWVGVDREILIKTYFKHIYLYVTHSKCRSYYLNVNNDIKQFTKLFINIISMELLYHFIFIFLKWKGSFTVNCGISFNQNICLSCLRLNAYILKPFLTLITSLVMIMSNVEHIWNLRPEARYLTVKLTSFRGYHLVSILPHGISTYILIGF